MKDKLIMGYYGAFAGIIILILVLPILNLVISIGDVLLIIAVSLYTIIVIYATARSISFVYIRGHVDGFKEGYELHYKQQELLKLK